jgi:hypothetical protein
MLTFKVVTAVRQHLTREQQPLLMLAAFKILYKIFNIDGIHYQKYFSINQHKNY